MQHDLEALARHIARLLPDATFPSPRAKREFVEHTAALIGAWALGRV